MRKNPSSKPPYSSEPPQNGKEQPHGLVDDFLRDLNVRDREKKKGEIKDLDILKDYFETCNFGFWELKEFRKKYGEQFNLLVARVDELIRAYGCLPDVIRRILLQRLEKDDFPVEEVSTPNEALGSEEDGEVGCIILSPEEVAEMRRDVQAVAQIEHEPVDPFVNTIPSSRPSDAIPNQLHDDIDRFLSTLLEAELFILFHCENLESIAAYEKYGISVDPESALKIQVGAKELMQKYGLTESDIREPILGRVRASGRPTQIADMNITDNHPAHEAIQKIVEKATPTLVEAGVAKVPLSPEMNNQEFVSALTDEGKKMVGDILSLKDIKDMGAWQALEVEHGKKGYVRLGQHVSDRVSSTAGKKEFDDALRGDDGAAVFARKRNYLTDSPWANRPPVESADSPKPSMAQLVAELSDENKNQLKEDMFGKASDEVLGMNHATVTFIKKMAANGLRSNDHLEELKRLLSKKGQNQPVVEVQQEVLIAPATPARLQSSNTTANFGVAAVQEISPRRTNSPWAKSKSPDSESPDDVNKFVDGYTGWRRNMLIDWLALPTDNLNAVWELVKKYKEYEKDEQNIAAPWKLEEDVTKLAKMIGCSLARLKEAFQERIEGGRVVTDNLRPKKILIDPKGKRAKTVLSVRKPEEDAADVVADITDKGFLNRLFGKKD